MEKTHPVTPSNRNRVLLVLTIISAAGFLLYARWVFQPYLAVDDFQILGRSWTWQRAWNNLWVPANEHAMPLGRLTTWALVQVAGSAATVPYLAVLQGPLSIVVGVLLLYLFVRRELGHPFYGLTAAALFGVSTVYEQAVYWFSASFSILTLDTLLLALLAAQAWRRSRQPAYLALCALGVALAPTWFASGILAGPLCALYLLPPEDDSGKRRGAALLRSALAAVVPLVGSVVFLAVSLPRTARTIMHLPHYGDQTALQSFHVLRGLQYSAWSVVENLLLGQLGISRVSEPFGLASIPFGLAIAVWPLLIVFGAWWWRGAPAGRRQMLLGLGLIFAGYLLVYSARAEWGYDGVMNQPMWSRYHLLPQLGLTLFLSGGLPRWAGRWRFRPGDLFTWEQVAALLVLVVVLAVTQWPRIAWTTWTRNREGDRLAQQEQQQALRRIDEADALCRRYRIGAATARAALEEADIPGGGSSPENRANAWEFLRGSPDPDPSITPDEARRRLRPVTP